MARKKNEIIEEVVEEINEEVEVNEEVNEEINEEVEVNEEANEEVEVNEEANEEVEIKETEIDTEKDSDDFGEEAPIILAGSVICEALNVRRAPNKESEVLGILHKDDIVNVYDIEDGSEYYTIKFNDIIAYCMKKFIRIPK